MVARKAKATGCVGESCFFILPALAFGKARVWGEFILSLSLSFQRVMSNSAFLKMEFLVLVEKKNFLFNSTYHFCPYQRPCIPWLCGLTLPDLKS